MHKIQIFLKTELEEELLTLPLVTPPKKKKRKPRKRLSIKEIEEEILPSILKVLIPKDRVKAKLRRAKVGLNSRKKPIRGRVTIKSLREQRRQILQKIKRIQAENRRRR